MVGRSRAWAASQVARGGAAFTLSLRGGRRAAAKMIHATTAEAPLTERPALPGDGRSAKARSIDGGDRLCRATGGARRRGALEAQKLTERGHVRACAGHASAAPRAPSRRSVRRFSARREARGRQGSLRATQV